MLEVGLVLEEALAELANLYTEMALNAKFMPSLKFVMFRVCVALSFSPSW